MEISWRTLFEGVGNDDQHPLIQVSNSAWKRLGNILVRATLFFAGIELLLFIAYLIM